MRQSFLPAVLVVIMSLLLANIAYQILPAADALCMAYGVYRMQAAAEGDNLYVLWEHETGYYNGQGDHNVFFKHSTDGGKTFGEVTSLYHSGPLCTAYPHMAVEGSNVYVMWGDGGDILFKASNDNGTSFGETITLGEGFLGNIGSAGPFVDGGRILASSDRVYVVWNDAQGEIIFRKSDDDGRSFGPPINVSKSDAQSVNPRIAASGNNIYVVWSEDARCEFMIEPTCSTKALFAKGYDPDGSLDEPVPVDKLAYSSFGEPMLLDKLTGDELSMPGFPSVAADGSNVYLLWKEKDNNLYFSSGNDRGQTFSSKVNLSKDYAEGMGAISIPSLWTRDGDVYVLLQAPGENGYLLLKSTDGGRNFERVTQPMPGEFKSEQSSNRQMIITEDGKAYLLWSIFSETERRVSFAAGYEDRSSVENQTDLVEKEYVPEIPPPSNVLLVASHDNVYALWLEAINATVSSQEQRIIMRASTDGGKTFGSATILEDVTTVPEFGTTAAIVAAALATGGIVAAARFTRYKRTNPR